jgi:hypothetical protein|tara:strand:- start:955 stop:1212 length:258 start_codon:yes stop_codon:yes gene_type:complete
MIEALFTLLLFDIQNPNQLVSKSIQFSAKHYTCEQMVKNHTIMLPLDNILGNHYHFTKIGKIPVIGVICPDWRETDYVVENKKNN